ncbi:MAG TPA: hydrogenase maturation protease [Actinomycetota bacterium]
MTDAVVIGVGNEFARDDAAGIEVVRRLWAEAPLGVEVVEHDGEPARLMELWAGRKRAWVVDAVRATDGSPGTVHRLEIGAEPIPDRPRRDSTHHLGLGDAVELSRAMGRLPGRLVLIAIEGAWFDTGVGMTPAVTDAVERVAGELRREVRASARTGGGR